MMMALSSFAWTLAFALTLMLKPRMMMMGIPQQLDMIVEEGLENQIYKRIFSHELYSLCFYRSSICKNKKEIILIKFFPFVCSKVRKCCFQPQNQFFAI
jgi:hypothetical protein